MAISFPFEFVDLGVPVPFVILPNPDFPGETKPLCILENQGVPPGPDTFITTGALPFPNDPDPWSATFHWATAGAPTAGEWQLDAFLEGVSAGVANIAVPATTSGPFPLHCPRGIPTSLQHYLWNSGGETGRGFIVPISDEHRHQSFRLRQEPEHPRRRASLATSPQGHSFSTLSRACARPARE